MHGCKVRNPNSDDIEGKWRAKRLAMLQPGAGASQLHQELGARNYVASAAKWTRHYPGLNRTRQATSHLQTLKQKKFELQGSSECQQHNEKHVQQDHGAHHRGWPSKGVQISLLAHGGLAMTCTANGSQPSSPRTAKWLQDSPACVYLKNKINSAQPERQAAAAVLALARHATYPHRVPWLGIPMFLAEDVLNKETQRMRSSHWTV